MGLSLDNLSANVRKLMSENDKMTVNELAEKTTLSSITIDRLLNKRGNPSWFTVSALAEFFKVDISVLTSQPKAEK